MTSIDLILSISFSGLHNSSQCTDCTGGYYCETPGKTKVTGPCQQGYFCETGSKSKTAAVCPAGKYCPTGTEVPKDCPMGTFSNTTELWSKDQCMNCTAGRYCGANGLTSTSGPCKAGYYCPEGSSSEIAVPCVIGLHCPEGMYDLRIIHGFLFEFSAIGNKTCTFVSIL